MITLALLSALQQRGFWAVFVTNDLATDVVAEQVLRDETLLQASTVVRETLEHSRGPRRLQLRPARSRSAAA